MSGVFDDGSYFDKFRMSEMAESLGGSPPPFFIDKSTEKKKTCGRFNPDFAIGRGIRRRILDFFFLKTLNRRFHYAFAFFVEKVSAFCRASLQPMAPCKGFVSVLAPIAKSGFKFHFRRRHRMGDPCILVIDDESAIAELIGDFFESMGYSVKTVTDSRDAVRMAKEFRPHLITLDLQMPEVDGFELLRAFKADPDTAGIPVIIVSVLAREVERQGLLSAAQAIRRSGLVKVQRLSNAFLALRSDGLALKIGLGKGTSYQLTSTGQNAARELIHNTLHRANLS